MVKKYNTKKQKMINQNVVKFKKKKKVTHLSRILNVF